MCGDFFCLGMELLVCYTRCACWMGYLFAVSFGAGDGMVACFHGEEKTLGSLVEYLFAILFLLVISSASIYTPGPPPPLCQDNLTMKSDIDKQIRLMNMTTKYPIMAGRGKKNYNCNLNVATSNGLNSIPTLFHPSPSSATSSGASSSSRTLHFHTPLTWNSVLIVPRLFPPRLS